MAKTWKVVTEAPVEPSTGIVGLELLPPDYPDDFWDGIVSDKTRRQIVGLALGVSALMPFTRAQVIATLSERPKCAPEMLEFQPGREDSPWDRSWIPQVGVRGQEFYNPLNGSL